MIYLLEYCMCLVCSCSSVIAHVCHTVPRPCPCCSKQPTLTLLFVAFLRWPNTAQLCLDSFSCCVASTPWCLSCFLSRNLVINMHPNYSRMYGLCTPMLLILLTMQWQWMLRGSSAVIALTASGHWERDIHKPQRYMALGHKSKSFSHMTLLGSHQGIEKGEFSAHQCY